MHLYSARLLRNQTVIGTSDVYSFVHVFQRIRTFSPERTRGTPPGSTMAGMKPSITPVNATPLVIITAICYTFSSLLTVSRSFLWSNNISHLCS